MKHGSIITPKPSQVPEFKLRTMTTHATAPPIQPVNWFKDCPPDGDALGNDDFGCCDPAADFRIVQLWGGKCSKDLVLNRYEQLTGFRSDIPSTDQGTDTNMDMRSWCSFPIYDGTKAWPTLWAQIPSNDLSQALTALQRFPLLVTLALPVAVADYPERWVLPPGSGAGWAPTEGHRVVLGGWDGSNWLVRTWGTDVPIGDAMFRLMLGPGVFDVPIPEPSLQDRFDLEGISFDALEVDLRLLVADA